MIYTIQIGVPTVLEQNVIWSMPVAVTRGFCESETMDLEVSMEPDPSGTWLPISDGVGSEGFFESAAPFIRCTNLFGRTVILKSGITSV